MKSETQLAAGTQGVMNLVLDYSKMTTPSGKVLKIESKKMKSCVN